MFVLLANKEKQLIYIYSKLMCPQCDRKIAEYKINGIDTTVLKLGVDYELEDLFEKIEKSDQPSFNPKSFPVVFDDDKLVV